VAKTLGLRKFRVFVQDVGDSGYSGLVDLEALDAFGAASQAMSKMRIEAKKLLALPANRKDLWPKKTTGLVPYAALEYRYDGSLFRG
jgi:hypothetical protein